MARATWSGSAASGCEEEACGSEIRAAIRPASGRSASGKGGSERPKSGRTYSGRTESETPESERPTADPPDCRDAFSGAPAPICPGAQSPGSCNAPSPASSGRSSRDAGRPGFGPSAPCPSGIGHLPAASATGHEQDSSAIRPCASVASALPGKRRLSSSNMMQASSFWPSAFRLMPSCNSAAPARGPSGAAVNASR